MSLILIHHSLTAERLEVGDIVVRSGVAPWRVAPRGVRTSGQRGRVVDRDTTHITIRLPDARRPRNRITNR